MHGIDDMTFTIILVFAHINDDGIVMIEHAGGFARTDFIEAADALPQFTADEHDKNGSKGRHQHRVIACKFDQLIDIHW